MLHVLPLYDAEPILHCSLHCTRIIFGLALGIAPLSSQGRGSLCRCSLKLVACMANRWRTSFIDFQQGVCEEWFQSDTHYMLQRQVLDEDGQNVSLTLRSIAVFLRTGIILGMHKCAECSGQTRLECSKSSSDGGFRYRWTCRTSGHKRMNHSVNSCGFLSKVNINNWMPFLRIMNMLCLGLPWVRITDEMRAGMAM